MKTLQQLKSNLIKLKDNEYKTSTLSDNSVPHSCYKIDYFIPFGIPTVKVWYPYYATRPFHFPATLIFSQDKFAQMFWLLCNETNIYDGFINDIHVSNYDLSFDHHNIPGIKGNYINIPIIKCGWVKHLFVEIEIKQFLNGNFKLLHQSYGGEYLLNSLYCRHIITKPDIKSEQLNNERKTDIALKMLKKQIKIKRL